MKEAEFVFKELSEEEIKNHTKDKFTIEKTGVYVKFKNGVQNTVTGEIFCDSTPNNP